MDPAAADLSLRLLTGGYDGLERERRRHDGADTFVTRLLGRRTVVVRGRDGVRLFYDSRIVQRDRAVPPPLKGLIFGRGGVQGLDDEPHLDRKAIFLELLADTPTASLVADVDERLGARVRSWDATVRVFDELVEVYGAAVLAWAGVGAAESEARRLSHRMAEIVDGIGFAGPAYVRGWRSRLVLDRWAAEVIRDVRARPSDAAAPASPLEVIASRADLDARTAGVELLNLLRPTVAVAWPATMMLSSLLRRPDRERLTEGDALRPYLHECRRLQPFAPALAGRVRRATAYDGVELRPGDRIVLDLVGTHGDPTTWSDHGGPEAFAPERFVDAAGEPVAPDPLAFVPHGGGDPTTGHRCPGESLTVRLLEVTARVLARADLDVVTGGPLDRSRIPTLPQPPLQVAPRPDPQH